ncbi:MAG: ATP-binding protein [Gammaproteobacteria bacterium]|nr:ATP-binding protein [Gammaproteobacteria bacterium]
MTETIYEIDESKKVLLDVNKKLLQQKDIIEHQVRLLNEKNKELRAFSHSVSHDLQGPIRRIEGFTKILLEDYKDKLDENAVEHLWRIYNAAEDMAEMIRAILRLGKVSFHQLALQEVNLSELAARIIQQLRQDEPDRKVEAAIKPDMRVKGDKTLLEMMLQNLLANAWKFTSKVSPAVIEFGEKIIDDKRTFYVKDNGVGFNAQQTNKLFKEFSRLHGKEEFAGTGIGLAIAYRIIIRHGGEIWAEGSKNQGAVFYFQLHRNIESFLQLNDTIARSTNA